MALGLVGRAAAAASSSSPAARWRPAAGLAKVFSSIGTVAEHMVAEDMAPDPETPSRGIAEGGINGFLSVFEKPRSGPQ